MNSQGVNNIINQFTHCFKVLNCSNYFSHVWYWSRQYKLDSLGRFDPIRDLVTLD